MEYSVEIGEDENDDDDGDEGEEGPYALKSKPRYEDAVAALVMGSWDGQKLGRRRNASTFCCFFRRSGRLSL